MKHIFIGGIGRSGTSILQHALSFHQELFTIPIETKFIAQVDGLHSLTRNLTTDYSPSHASVAVERFKRLMYEVITHTGPNPYDSFPDIPYARLVFLPQEIFPNYYEILDQFFSQIKDHFFHRSKLIELCRELIDGLFSENATARGANGWIEKTPSNIASIEFLYELYPDAIFINCIRDPRGVLHSFRRLNWINGSLEEVAEHISAYYDYLAIKREFGKFRPHQYYEIRLEDLVEEPEKEITNILSFLQATPYSDERNEYLKTTLRKGSMRWSDQHGRYCDAWENEYSPEEISLISKILAKAIESYGYLI
jgi:hypothetical protein